MPDPALRYEGEGRGGIARLDWDHTARGMGELNVVCVALVGPTPMATKGW